ncbi:malate dehydrogenase [Staphylococcus saprophyticus]|jgi:malate dehydrogenase|uniref:Malate dehydrogenase n=1 Tax=Staphylococcus saprophyticus subsp. saprophyticus (strain ATCC 15305 / DSM 20229 / NCIMB 8711 / NCTC 7292 / S-41) TaxID=342451 RepID=MDH_STAS1|nr:MULTISPECIES: malate dehydrogenase [Staphylococcus]Q49VN8.1 RecName: Full=Malate dehydrogenase [Staphylococcus saprophyticus subsp. saprophyticus ATCC 15305 = NCTC 7292]CRV25097.1 L-lactate dehydrogenase 1 [Streptococcus equi subsp. equi]AMG18755.1 malate dehydrogenase [Staphylococcus saprophyticus]AMG34145.1 malate dehydrogenase [Staphylococcus saprophyticus]ASE57778.1 malate dehydrogenase [Staphylococcus saprophyticus]ASF18809.1 malate dehydrogenase [Staphylococcus saprophyticus]
MTKKKISIIGAGNTGATLAFIVAQHELADVVLIDRPDNEGQVKGKALDIFESSPVYGFDAKVTGSVNYADTADSDIVVITAGSPRKPGMSRDDLVQINEKVMFDVTKEIVKYSPDCKIIVLTNPVDAMTYSVLKASGFPKERVIGQSGVLDTARYQSFIAEALNVSIKDIRGLVLGGHGDTMVPLVNSTNVNGVPLHQLLNQTQIEQIVERTRKGGAEIVALLGNGSAYYAPASAVFEMIEAILKDQHRLLPSIALLEGEYGFSDICLGVPTVLSEKGIENIVELALSDNEQAQLRISADSVEEVKQALKNQ